MKRCGVIVVAMLVAFCAVAATNVPSVNAVGFIRTTVADSGFAFVCLPFNEMNSTFTIPEVVKEVPLGTEVSYFTDGAWQSTVYVKPIGQDPKWSPDPTNVLIRGDALFVKAPSGQGDVVVTVLGEVPDSRTAPTTDYYIEGTDQFTAFGFSYPADVPLTNTQLHAEADIGDSISWWDQGVGDWGDSVFVKPIGQDPRWTVDVTLETGKGYFYMHKGDGFTWQQQKPYTTL